MSTISVNPVGTLVSKWGEGPIWHQDSLLYVDIEGHKVIRFNPVSGEEKVWNVGERVGTVVPRQSGGLIFAGDKGISSLNEETGAIELLAAPETHLPHNRFNDGKCDPAGRLWAGTMPTDTKRPAATLYCMFADHRVEKKFGPVTVSNGLVWTKDTQTLYYIDSPRRNVLAFDFDNSTGEITNERVAVDTAQWDASPDGMAIDTDDRLWVAFCHGSAVRCFDPKTGVCEAEIPLPCREVTACAFGGPDMMDLYITTGIPGKDPEPLTGRLFVAQPGAKGAPTFSFAG